MNEEFLHYIWQFRLFNSIPRSMQNEEIEVYHPGFPNKDAGPDFTEARIRIGETLWVGNVEVHVRSSDWYLHHHQDNEDYSNIILHVVYENDRPVFDKNGQPLTTLELKYIFNPRIFNRYQAFLYNKSWIPCNKDVLLVDKLTWDGWLERLVVERIERKSEEITRLLRQNRNDWEETFYQVLGAAFGFKVNEQPFQMLLKSLPLQIIGKHRDNLMQVEALLFGQAGMLRGTFEDEYPRDLKQEYEHLSRKFSLMPLPGHIWKFLRLRPSNFPTIRIAQFAALLFRCNSLFSMVLNKHVPADILRMFDVKASSYWDNHFRFDKKSAGKTKNLGELASHTIVINSVVHFLYIYGKETGDTSCTERAIELLSAIPPEKNAIISGWGKTGIMTTNAAETQALLELKNKYCYLKKCLHCRVGIRLLSMNI